MSTKRQLGGAALWSGDGKPGLGLAAPFAAVAAACLAVILVPPYVSAWWVYTLAAAVLACVGGSFALSLREAERTWLDAVPAYLMFVFVALVHHAAGGAVGGSSSGLSAAVLLPILWLAITGTRRELGIASGLTVLVFVAPIVLVGPPAYGWGDWRRIVVWSAVALVLGPLVQRIVHDLDRQTRRARLANERVERLFDDAPHGVALLDAAGVILRVNTSLAVTVGLEPSEMVGHHLGSFETPGEHAIADHLERLMSDRVDMDAECRLRDSGGNDVAIALSSTVVPDPQVGDIVMVNVVDISDRRRYLDRLSHLADHDVLTGLANRRRFEVELERHLDRCRRHGPVGALLLLDLDNFKQVNDSLGHNAGDELLVTIAGLLRRSIRSTDVVARVGGDEFAIMLTDGDQAATQRVADQVVERIRDHAATLDGVRRRVSASVGAVTFAAATEHSADILALADMTMYDAKESGRNRVALLAEGDSRSPRSSMRLQWQARIEDALDNDRFVLHFQPIMDIATGRIDSAEVLLRLRGEDGEIVPPGRFVYIAERAGLMPRVDSWVLDRSIEMLAQLRELVPDFCLEVNISGASMGDASVEATILSALRRFDVDPKALILEITETSAVADVALAREFAERMAAMGCRFALDDFGAGFGSFYYLKHLIFDYVKIDGEFVAHVHRSSVDRTIVRSIVGIAKDLGKQTVAEFVSDPEIFDVVRAEGVDYAQGFMIGKPVPMDVFVEDFMLTPAGMVD
ncbi:putative bifunctional diguanylate cyclase/phosphodiesterase [Nocardioides baculatus]|uniref:EAL domain-containing protein n=1 Tax=Nocardioides baculatus TaxID=2801337 RepID=A0ABS1L4M1_9ACTN|nr:EAL domain-containing protein [Nocardioides baculatus]MBL0746383.1 EAL domain-containing protein [Nocardioides baculatus]